jgi:hypothetical protein
MLLQIVLLQERIMNARPPVTVLPVLLFAALICLSSPALPAVSPQYTPVEVPADIQSVQADWERFADARRYPSTLVNLKAGMWDREVVDVLGREPDRIDYSLATYGVFQEWHYPDGVVLYFTYCELDSWRMGDQEEPASDTGLLKKIIRGLFAVLDR